MCIRENLFQSVICNWSESETANVPEYDPLHCGNFTRRSVCGTRWFCKLSCQLVFVCGIHTFRRLLVVRKN